MILSRESTKPPKDTRAPPMAITVLLDKERAKIQRALT
jgi:hypothetical protein